MVRSAEQIIKDASLQNESAVSNIQAQYLISLAQGECLLECAKLTVDDAVKVKILSLFDNIYQKHS